MSGSKNAQSAVSVAFVENREFLKRFLRRYFSRRQDVEDVVQEAYLRAYAAEQSKEIDHPKAFLFQIAKNVALTELTRKSRQITEYLEEAGVMLEPGSEASVADEIEAQETLGLYCEAVSMLPAKCREVFLLRRVHGLRHKEIAERMALSRSSVAKYYSRAVLAVEAYSGQRSPRRSIRSKQGKQ